MKTIIIQSYRTHDVPLWIGRCLASVDAWARFKGYDYWLTDDRAFLLCGADYLNAVGDNKRSITNLCRLELIRSAFLKGYDRAIWMDADIFVFAPERLEFEPTPRIAFPRETWLYPVEGGWGVMQTLNNCVVACPRDDPDLDLIIQATRHRARHHPIVHNQQLGVQVIRGLHQFLQFPLLPNVGMFSNYVVMALALDKETLLLAHQARHHGTPVYAANLSASDDYVPVVPEAQALLAMDVLERSAGDIINAHLRAAPNPGAG